MIMGYLMADLTKLILGFCKKFWIVAYAQMEVPSSIHFYLSFKTPMHVFNNEL